ncbi:hypothetical protein [Verrucomicrobium sp. BvORR106]|uniref:hypothetical protein n=1 Tax=Verrucomicrobium sp. BvORR106 TaxID=1403819 RepID=UPI00056F2A8B|nr:hypothetical protein [Verrucomicrobium sp. BvORR106]
MTEGNRRPGMPWWWTPVYNQQEPGQKLLRQAEPFLKKLGVELVEYFTEEEAEVGGVPAHITLGVDAARMRLMVVYPRWDGRFTEERLAKRVGVELIDAAWASIMHRRWELKGQKTSFAEYLQHQERLLLAALDRCKPASLVFLQAANIWCGKGKEDEYPPFARKAEAREKVHNWLPGMMLEIGLEMVEVRRSKKIEQREYDAAMHRLLGWLSKCLQLLRAAAADPATTCKPITEALKLGRMIQNREYTYYSYRSSMFRYGDDSGGRGWASVDENSYLFEIYRRDRLREQERMAANEAKTSETNNAEKREITNAPTGS